MKIISDASVRLCAALTAAVLLPSVAAASMPLVSLEAPVSRWEDAVPLGNGGAGALLWGGGETLNITLDRADFWHNVEQPTCQSPDFTWSNLVDAVNRRDDAKRRRIFSRGGQSATKLPGVRFVLKLSPGQRLVRFRLDRRTAAATVTVATAQGERELLAWFDDGDNLLSLRVPAGVTFAEKSFRNNPSFARLGGYPEPVVDITADRAVYRRFRRAGGTNRFDADFEAGVRFRAAADGPRSAFWSAFHAQSDVTLPDPAFQRMYDFTLYLYGAGARAGHPPLALQGLWTADNGGLPPWNGDYHNDLNTEMTYWAAGPAGQIEALDAFADFYLARLPECRAFCRKLFNGAPGAVIPPTMGLAAQPIAGWTAYFVPPIHGIWVFDTMCEAWVYDPAPAKAAKLLAFGRELAAGMEQTWKMVNGVRKLAISCSPEINDDRMDCFLNANSSYERAILESFYDYLARLATACGRPAEAARWRAYSGTFGAPNVTKDGVLEVSAGHALTASHRHASHLMQIFPLTNVPKEPGVDFVRSVTHWEDLGTRLWVGYSFSWAGCFEARLGRGDRAYRYLNDFQRAFVSRCGFHLNGDQLKCGLSAFTYRPFTLEGNFAFARAVQEMLLSCDVQNNTYTLFGALPRVWDGKTVSFRNLRLPGGHRVSATRHADGSVTQTLVPYPGATSLPRLAAGKPSRRN
jgi:alpha-L-fucosidase 2